MRRFKAVLALGLLQLGACSHLATDTSTAVDDLPLAAETGAVTIYRPLPEDSVYDLLVAEFAIRRQAYDLALTNYMHQAQRTRDVGVVSTAARLAQFVNDDEAALKATGLWLELVPDDRDAHYIAASSLARTRRPHEALTHMIAVLNQGDEGNFAALAASALSLPEAEQVEFLAALDALIGEHPKVQSLKTAKALMLQYRNREKEALALIREVLKAQPDDMHALLIETRLLQQLDRHDEALKRLAYAVDTYPTHKRLRLQYAQQLARSDLHQAKAQYTLLLQQYPEDTSILLGLALINREIGNLQEARMEFQQLLGYPEERARATYFLGRLEEQEQNWQKAIDYYLQVGSGEEFMPAMHRMVPLVEQQSGIAAAREQLATLRQQYPDFEVQLYLVESDLLFDHRAYEAGHVLLTEALRKYPQQPSLLYTRSLFSERRNNLALLEQDLRTILNEDPDNATALNALGYSLAIMTDRLDEARQLVAKALELRPEDPAIQDSYGWIAYRQGDLKQAHSYLQRAFKQSQDHEISAHLGEVLWVMGEKQDARKVWRDGLKNLPDSPIIRETMQRLNVPDAP